MSQDVETELVKLIIKAVPVEAVAEAAANSRVVCNMFTLKVNDAVMPEITVGHGLVIVCYGSEYACQRVKQAVSDLQTIP